MGMEFYYINRYLLHYLMEFYNTIRIALFYHRFVTLLVFHYVTLMKCCYIKKIHFIAKILLHYWKSVTLHYQNYFVLPEIH